MASPFARLALCALVAGGCARAPGGDEPLRIAFGPAETATVKPVSAAGLRRTVTLIDAGREPRQPVRYRLTAGAAHRCSLAFATRSKAQMMAANATITLDARVEAVAPDGESVVRLTLTDIELGETEAGKTVVDQQVRALALVRGKSDDLHLGPGGELRQNRRLLTAGMGMGSYLIVTFPAEPIGVGARWRADETLANAIVMTIRSTYELVARDGDRLTLRIDDVISGVRQPMTPAGEVTAVGGRQSGEEIVDLTRPLPASGKFAGTTLMSLLVGDNIKLDFDMALDVTFQSP